MVVNQFCIHSQMPKPIQPKGKTGTSVLVIIVRDETLRVRGKQREDREGKDEQKKRFINKTLTNFSGNSKVNSLLKRKYLHLLANLFTDL